jgi:superoxide dismutase, Fe-Mn family
VKEITVPAEDWQCQGIGTKLGNSTGILFNASRDRFFYASMKGKHVPINRRSLLAAGLTAATFAPRIAVAQTPAGPFKLDPLPYPTTALQPYIDAKTMEIHHNRHHQAYVTGLNNAVKDYPKVAAMPLEEILAKLSEMPEPIRTMLRNFGGGHANHSMFWPIMGSRGVKPTGDLMAAIDRDLGGMKKFQEDFNAQGARVFGSGWVFVTATRDGKLAIETRPNQDTPLMDGKRVLMGNDVWEHAYYLTYQNRRPDYLTAWWNVVNWPRVSQRYLDAQSGKLAI